MEHLKGLSNDELEAKIKEREQELKMIIDFVTDVVLKNGQMHGSSINGVKWELKNFGGFDLFFYPAGDPLGGDHIQIWHLIDRASSVVCLSIYLQGSFLKVDNYNNTYLWREKLMDIISRKEEIIKDIGEAREQEKQSFLEKKSEENRRKELLKEAERLKL